MGRLATHLAAVAASVDNLPPTNQLPRVSLWDALLPKGYPTPSKQATLPVKKEVIGVAATAGATATAAAVGSRLQLSLHFSPPLNNIPSNRPSPSSSTNTNFQPPDRRPESHSHTPAGPMLVPVIFVMKDKHVHFEGPVANPQPQQSLKSSSLPETGGECSATQWCDVRRDHKGRKVIVAHKSPCYGNGPSANGGDSKGGTEDVKKGANGNGNGDKVKEGEKGGDDKKGDVKTDGAGNGGDENGGGNEKKPHELTLEEDEKLITLKAEGKSWKEIVAEMGKPKGVLTQRWKVIDPAKAGGDGGAAAKTGGGHGDKKEGDKPAAAAEEKKDEEPKKMTKAEKKAAKAAAAKAEAEEAKAMEQAKSSPPSLRSAGKAGSKAGSKARSKADDSDDGWLTLQEDNKWAFAELQLLAELVARYGFLWELVAAKFYDITGRRVFGYEVREKFGFPA